MKRFMSMPVLVGGLALLAALGIAAFVFLTQVRDGQLVQTSDGAAIITPKVKIGGAFEMRDQFGETVTEASYPDKYKLIYFGYANCPDVCPTDLFVMGQAMAQLEEEQPEIAGRIQPVFVSVDPARDTPDFMKEYVLSFHERMVGLAGDSKATAEMAKAFRVYFKLNEPDEDGDYSVDHSALTYFMGPDGTFKTMFRHNSDPAKVADGVRKIINSEQG